ncbi:hypothetical protein JST97_23035 [bacterium]|nr:hypothetical protein [bacterium]
MSALRKATLGLFFLVLAADMIGSPPPGFHSRVIHKSDEAGVWELPTHVAQATRMYVQSRQPEDWEKRRAGAEFLLGALNPPRLHRTEWEALARELDQAQPAATAWDCALQLTQSPVRSGGLLGAYQNRLDQLRARQVGQALEPLKPILQVNDYRAFLEQVPAQGQPAGFFDLMVSMRPMAQLGREDLLPYPLWWGVLVNQSDGQALQAGLRLARGQSPQFSYRREGSEILFWTVGPDGIDDGGALEASRKEVSSGAQGGDWIYRFRL